MTTTPSIGGQEGFIVKCTNDHVRSSAREVLHLTTASVGKAMRTVTHCPATVRTEPVLTSAKFAILVGRVATTKEVLLVTHPDRQMIGKIGRSIVMHTLMPVR